MGVKGGPAFAGEGVEDLIVAVEAALEESMVQFEALVPYSEGHIINQVREEVRQRCSSENRHAIWHVSKCSSLGTYRI
jgi:hypothetical protein